MDCDPKLINRLLTACRILDREGIMDELGHFSVKIPGKEHVLVNGKISPGQAKEADLVLLDYKGKKLAGNLEPAKEMPLHLSVYRMRKDIAAIAHTHSPTIISLSLVGKKLRAMENLGATVFGNKVPVYEKLGLIDTFDAGLRMAEALGSARVLVLKGHGNVVVGESIEEVCVSAIWAEKAARLQCQAMLLGDPEWFPEDEIGKVADQVRKGKAFERAWEYFRWRLQIDADREKR
ncbi:MAG: class II aldolase/adducin family protein [Deltaproteobacteria bacterium]|nr:class II aldolase/adducin family protein [Deltaproteobacteria bacterium]